MDSEFYIVEDFVENKINTNGFLVRSKITGEYITEASNISPEKTIYLAATEAKIHITSPWAIFNTRSDLTNKITGCLVQQHSFCFVYLDQGIV